MTATTIAAWLLTYLIHSTILLTAALAVSRILGGRNLAAQEGLLRTALIGGVLTATLQLGLGISPVGGVFALDTATQPFSAGPISAPLATGIETVAPAGPTAGLARALTPATALIALWFLATLTGLIAVLRSIVDLRRLLRTRSFQPTGRLLKSLAAAVGLRRPVRLSTSKAVVVPFATGIRQPEICCPERVNELAHEHRRGLFAHELAHLARRDPAWQLVYRLGEALLVMQPLNRLVRRRLEEIAEHLTDERAADCTGDRLGLARCLVVVAHWGHASGLGLPATALAAGPRLDRRIRRLISGTADRQSTGSWALPIGIALVLVSISILPAVATRPAHAELSLNSEADSPTWSSAEDRPADEPPPPPAPPKSSPTVPEPAPAPAPPTSSPAVPEAAPAPPAPESSPAPGIGPVGTVGPAPAAPADPAEPAEPAEVERRRAAARSRASAEAMERASREAHDSTRARDAEREALRLHIRVQRSEAERLAREEMLAERDRARVLAAEARAVARESIINGKRLTAEQREELRRQSLELRAQAAAQNREAADRMREKARTLAAEARRLAEQAEAERLEREKEQR